MSSQSSKNGQNAVIFLSFFYAVLSIIGRDLRFLPNPPAQADFRLGIFIPAMAAIIFGPLTGGLTAGIGNLLIDLYTVFEGNEAELDLSEILGALGNFLGGYVTGFLANRVKALRSNGESMFQPRLILPYTFASIIGLSLVTGSSIAYGIIYWYGNATNTLFSVAGDIPLTVANSFFLFIFFVNSLVLLIFVPLSLLTYQLVNTFSDRRFDRINREKMELDIEYQRQDIQVDELGMTDHAMWKNQWNPMHLKITNNQEEPAEFEFEAVSNSRIFPQSDRTYKLQPGEQFTQTFYIMPHEQEEVIVRYYIGTDSHDRSFGQESTAQTIASVRAGTMQVRSEDNLSQFSSVNILVFIVSILWSNVIELINQGLQDISDQITVILVFLGLEVVLFVPFLYLMYQRFQSLSEEEQTIDISFTSLLDSHIYKKETITFDDGDGVDPVIVRILQYLIRGIAVAVLVLLLANSYLSAYGQNILFYDVSLVLVIIGLILLSEVVLQNFRGDGANELSIILEEGKVITEFKPQHPFKINEPNDVLVEVFNPTQTKGIRIGFQAVDTISPNLIELHLEPQQSAIVKLAITVVEEGVRELISIAYPLFDEQGRYVNRLEAEPISYQQVEYTALGTTIFGMTEYQFEMLKRVAGLGTILAAGLVTISQFFQIDQALLQFRDSLPILAILQIPFVYLYFYFNNRFKSRFNL